MKDAYTRHGGTKKTPQSQSIPGKDQIENNAGGYAFDVGVWSQLERFLILGSEGGTYYVGETQLTEENVETLYTCLHEDYKRAIDLIVDISDQGRAVSNDPALFALAAAAGFKYSVATRNYALRQLPKVARIFTHLAHFLEYVQQFRGWGRMLREAVADWYNNKEPQHLAYQIAKYRKRDGWTHADALRLAHPTPVSGLHNWLYGYAVGKENIVENMETIIMKGANDPRSIIAGFELGKDIEDAEEIIKLVDDYGLTREMIPTEFLNNPEVQEALFAEGEMPTWALLRNLGNFAASGFLVDQNFDAVDQAVEALSNQERLHKSRMHPLKILVGMRQYEGGTSGYGHNSWAPAQKIVDALDEAFYLSFDNVEPTGKRMLLACDVSGSMSRYISQRIPITCAEAVGALALVTAAVEDRAIIRGFSAGSRGYNRRVGRIKGSMDGFVDLGISPQMRLTSVVDKIDSMNFGNTDCALPMVWALKNEVDLDAFVILTDNETWYGDIHPIQALEEYRNKFNPRAKLIIVGMTSTEISIADPDDPLSLDVVGFDTSTPSVISEFIRG